MFILRTLLSLLRFVLDSPLLASRSRLQLQHTQKIKGGSTDLVALPLLCREVKHEHFFITHICAIDVLSALRHIPTALYVAVETNSNVTKTLNKPILVGKEVVEWHDEILLPSERPSAISFKVYASFHPRLGNGELLFQFDVTVGEVLDCGGQLLPIELKVHNTQEGFLSFSSLKITTKRRIYEVDEYQVTRLDPSGLDNMRQLVGLTDAGYHTLLRFHQTQNREDLNQAIAYFERVRDMCPTDHPNYSTVLSNVATAKSILLQAYSVYFNLDVPITLFQDTFRLRTSAHSDYSAIALTVGLALLIHSKARGDEATWMEVKNILFRVAELSPVESYEYRAARRALETSIMLDCDTSKKDSADLDDEMIRMGRAVLLRLADRDPRRPAVLAALGKGLYFRFKRNGDLADIHEAIFMLENAIRLAPDGCPDKPAQMDDLGTLFLIRFEHVSDPVDISKSVSVREEAVRLTPNNHPETPARLSDLGTSLSHRFRFLGDLADINKAITMQEEAVYLTPNNHPEKPARLNELGISLSSRFERLGCFADINKSVSIQEEAVHLTPNAHPDRMTYLSSLGESLLLRFHCRGDLMDINKAISIQQEVVRLTPNDHPDKPTRLNSLGSSLSSRFEHFGDLGDISKSILMIEEAIRLTPVGYPDKSTWLNNLGRSLSRRFEHLGDLTDINKSISVIEEAVSLTSTDGDPRKPAGLNNLGLSLSCRFHHLGKLVDLNRSISMFEGAVCLASNDLPNKPAWLNNLGRSLLNRFEQFGDITDLNKSISMQEEVLHLTPDGHPDKPAWWAQLGTSLISRFGYLGGTADISRSVLMFEKALRLTPDGHRDKPARLNYLGNALSTRFSYFGDASDADSAILMHEEALQLTPDSHPQKPSRLNNLGVSLIFRFERCGDLMDINKSILKYEEAVNLTSNFGRSEDPSFLNNLGLSLSHRFRSLHDVADINKSILMHEKAVHLTPDGHPDKPTGLNNLGNAFMHSFNHAHDSSSLSSAALCFSAAARASSGPTYSRFFAARNWISSAHLIGDPQALIDAYATAIDILPQLAWLGLPLTERHRLLLNAADIARDAAAAAMDAGRPELAAEWLEQGRSVVWTQFLQLRTPVDELRIEHPSLADQLQRISRELEHASSRQQYSMSHMLMNNVLDDNTTLEKEVQRHHALALAREKLLLEIRSLPGFDRFLLSRTVKQLATEAAHPGPVVYLNASKYRCDALVVMPEVGSVIPVVLPIKYPEVEQLYGLIRLLLKRNCLIISRDEISAIAHDEKLIPQHIVDSLLMRDDIEFECGSDTGRAVRIKPQKIEGYKPEDLFRVILVLLWEKVTNPILEVLGLTTLGQSGGRKMTRIYWCPTGPFTFLPIHAAGLYGTAGQGVKLSDFAISSYIPTLSSISPKARKDLNNRPSSTIRLVAVPQPSTDGLAKLNSVQREIDHIKSVSSRSPFVALQESNGNIEDVTEKMKCSDWVHFACHGVQDPDDPLSSGLCLADGRRLKLFDIIKLSRHRGGLAFLSACQTAQGDVKLAEESVHLAAGMLLAGYENVIATMWSIMDDDAPNVAKEVYARLFRDGKVPDSAEAAEALHYATQRLRDSGASFFSWVPFVHVGR